MVYQQGGSPFGGRVPPATRALMITTALASIAIVIAANWLQARSLAVGSLLTPDEVLRGKLWQLVTYALVARDPLDLVFTVLLLWMFGAPLERRVGPRAFLLGYLGIAALAAVLTVGVGLLIDPVRYGTYGGTAPMMAALVAAFAMSNPDAVILYSFIIPMKGKTLLALDAAVVALYILFSGTAAPFVPHVAALGLGALWGAGPAGPRRAWLRLRAWWIERKLQRSHLKLVDEEEEETRKRGPWLH
jgi:membrane associated rhomboid family serine protease